MKSHPNILASVAVAYCAWRSNELLNAWEHSPMDKWGGLAFLIWLGPVYYALLKRSQEFDLRTVNYWLLAMGLGMTLVGSMSSMNMAHYCGLTLTVLSWIRWRRQHIFWAVGAIAWMPVFGYSMSRLFSLNSKENGTLVLLIRVVWVVLAVAPMLIAIYRMKKDFSKTDSPETDS